MLVLLSVHCGIVPVIVVVPSETPCIVSVLPLCDTVAFPLFVIQLMFCPVVLVTVAVMSLPAITLPLFEERLKFPPPELQFTVTVYVTVFSQ